MLLKQIKSENIYKNFSYLLGCKKSKKGAVIDPADQAEKILSELQKEELTLEYIINTHNHPDHIADNLKLKNSTKAQVIQHNNSAKGDISVNDGESIQIGSLSSKFIHTPGHTDHDICILVNNDLFTGDTLFVGKVGGTSGKESAESQYYSLKKLMELQGEINIWPGHDNGVTPSSTIEYERENNPFCLRLENFEQFYYLKENWQEFKRKHNIE